jgi:DNA-binding MarR family transcriptional regulator
VNELETGSEADLAIQIVGAARVIADRLGEAVERAGVDDMRTPFGYVIRVLADRDRTLTELADLLGVSKQAAIKIVDEMEARGFLFRHPDPDDRRVKLLRLTDRGRKVRRATLAASHAIERELRRGLGDPDVDAVRTALEALLETHAALEDARAGRSRAPW